MNYAAALLDFLCQRGGPPKWPEICKVSAAQPPNKEWVISHVKEFKISFGRLALRLKKCFKRVWPKS